jgi:hypothetical protein
MASNFEPDECEVLSKPLSLSFYFSFNNAEALASPVPFPIVHRPLAERKKSL